MVTAIKERPILFSGPMVRAILSGRKTQTRRIIKPQPELTGQIETFPPVDIWGLSTKCGYICGDTESFSAMAPAYCPHGFLGDRLWVRETWLPLDEDHHIGDCKYAYRATTSGDGEDARKEFASCGRKYQWRPSIHMPRCASRIILEITDVRVERLNEISDTDAISEGVLTLPKQVSGPLEKSGRPPLGPTPREQFATLWESINGPATWGANPWVWVIEFKLATDS